MFFILSKRKSVVVCSILNSHYLYYAKSVYNFLCKWCMLATKRSGINSSFFFELLSYVTDYCYHHSFVLASKEFSMYACKHPVTTFCCTFAFYPDHDIMTKGKSHKKQPI